MDQIEQLTRLLVEFHERFASWENAVIQDSGLTLPRMHTLEMIGSLGEPRMKELAVKMGVTTGALTVLVDRLVQAGLVERRPDAQDRRSIRVVLTEAGKSHFEAHHRLHRRLTEEIICALSDEEAAQFMTMLEKLIEHF
ncbi:MAG: MarR family winged helix-turn-helix transcriptional regulator [Desulfovibrionaceae bacterium]|jgi:DNA-binding MarR family transcriptional regulator